MGGEGGGEADLFEDKIGDGGVGVDDDGGHLVVADLLQQGGGVQVVVQHPDRQRLPGDEEASHQLLQSQQAWGVWLGRRRSHRACFLIKQRK